MGRTTQFVIFFSIIFSLFGLMHFYVYRKVVSQTNLPSIANKTIIIFLAFMIISPILCRMHFLKDIKGITYAFTLFSSLWIGFIFYLFLINVGVDLINAFCKLISLFALRKNLPLLIPKGYSTLFSTLLITFGICFYGYFWALNIGVTRITIQTPKLPESLDELVIAQISDLHLGVLVGEKRLEKVLGVLSEINPDILVSTGDLVDEDVNSMHGLAEQFRVFKPRFGKYAVTGNHEFYAGMELSERFTRDSGFVLLRNEYINLNGFINLIGLDDPTARIFGNKVGKDISKLISECNPNLFTLLLFHQPINFKGNTSQLPIDLQLSGHTHGGQLFPFIYLTRIVYPLASGFFEANGTKLYVSRGTGTWGPPIRFLSPPEIVVIKLEHVKM